MKILIGAACICIIAATGYYAWREYQRAHAAEYAARLAYDNALEAVKAKP